MSEEFLLGKFLTIETELGVMSKQIDDLTLAVDKLTTLASTSANEMSVNLQTHVDDQKQALLIVSDTVAGLASSFDDYTQKLDRQFTEWDAQVNDSRNNSHNNSQLFYSQDSVRASKKEWDPQSREQLFHGNINNYPEQTVVKGPGFAQPTGPGAFVNHDYYQFTNPLAPSIGHSSLSMNNCSQSANNIGQHGYQGNGTQVKIVVNPQRTCAYYSDNRQHQSSVLPLSDGFTIPTTSGTNIRNHVPVPKPFYKSDSSRGVSQFRIWLERFENYVLLQQIPMSQLHSILMGYLDGEAHTYASQLDLVIRADYYSLCDKLLNYFDSRQNVYQLRRHLESIKQKSDEPFRLFVTRLRSAALSIYGHANAQSVDEAVRNGIMRDALEPIRDAIQHNERILLRHRLATEEEIMDYGEAKEEEMRKNKEQRAKKENQKSQSPQRNSRPHSDRSSPLTRKNRLSPHTSKISSSHNESQSINSSNRSSSSSSCSSSSSSHHRSDPQSLKSFYLNQRTYKYAPAVEAMASSTEEEEDVCDVAALDFCLDSLNLIAPPFPTASLIVAQAVSQLTTAISQLLCRTAGVTELGSQLNLIVVICNDQIMESKSPHPVAILKSAPVSTPSMGLALGGPVDPHKTGILTGHHHSTSDQSPQNRPYMNPFYQNQMNLKSQEAKPKKQHYYMKN